LEADPVAAVLEYWSNGVTKTWNAGVGKRWSIGVLEYWKETRRFMRRQHITPGVLTPAVQKWKIGHNKGSLSTCPISYWQENTGPRPLKRSLARLI